MNVVLALVCMGVTGFVGFCLGGAIGRLSMENKVRQTEMIAAFVLAQQETSTQDGFDALIAKIIDGGDQ
jgi:hypothetical protein